LINSVIRDLTKWKDHPIETACFAVMSPLTAAGVMLAQAAFVYVTDRKKFNETCKSFNEMRKNLTAKQTCYMLGYFFGPGFAKTYGGSKAKLFKRKFVNSQFLKALQQQEKMKLAIEGVGDFSQNMKMAMRPIRSVTQKAIQQVVQAGKNIAKQILKSPAGLIYGLDRKFGTRIQHVFAHAVPDSSKKIHSIFSVPKNQILKLVDEAWLKRGSPLNSAYHGKSCRNARRNLH
jgi:hypothetical protein